MILKSLCSRSITVVGAINAAIRPTCSTVGAITHIRDNDTSIRFAPDTMKTGGVPAVCVALQATVLRGYDAVLTAAQNIPFVGVRGKYGKLT